MYQAKLSHQEEERIDMLDQQLMGRLCTWMQYLDKGGQLMGYSQPEMMHLFVDSAAHDGNVALQTLKMQAVFDTITEQLEAETGDTVMVMINRPRSDEWRVIVHCDRMMLLDLHYRGKQPLNFSDVGAFLNAVDRLTTLAVAEWFKKSRAVRRRRIH